MTSKKNLFIRKFIHIITGILFILYASEFDSAIWFLGIFVILILILDFLRKFWPSWGRLFLKIFGPLLKEDEVSGELTGAVTLWSALYIAFLLFPLQTFQISGSIGVLADPAGAIIGSRVGKRIIYRDKTVIGSLAFWIIAFFLVWQYWNIPLLHSLLLSIILMLIEIYIPEKWENLGIVLIGAIIIQLIS